MKTFLFLFLSFCSLSDKFSLEIKHMKAALVLGGSGFVGAAVASALRRDGWRVVCVVRSLPFARQGRLERDGVELVVGSPADPASYADHLARAELVLDATLDYGNPTAVPEAVLEAMEGHAAASSKRFLYCSGLLVAGRTPANSVALEWHAPVDNWRAKVEALVLGGGRAGRRVARAVLRPGFIYGGDGGDLTRWWFESDSIEGDAGRRLGWVHIDDVAAAFVAAASAPPALIQGEIFFVSEDNPSTWREVRNALAAAAGKQTPLPERPATDAEKWADVHVVPSSEKLRRVLGWYPRHAGPIIEAHISHSSWKAHQKA